MRSRSIVAVLLVVLAVGCGADDPTATGPAKESVAEPETAVEFVEAGKGKVVVLLLGMEGCAKTGEATRALGKLAPGFPEDVRVARLDVPQPNDAMLGIEDWRYPYFYAVDDDRKIAEPLDFFYYPTLYLLDREGEVRFAGGCEPANLVAMIDEVRSEKPGDEKTIFTPPLPAVGAAAPEFAAKGLDDEDHALWGLRLMGSVFLLFSAMDCPFSVKAVTEFDVLAEEAEDLEITFVAIEKAGDARTVAGFYDEQEFPGPVIHDVDGAIRKAFGVEPAPFFFLVGKDGKIEARGPYTPEAARSALGLDTVGASSAGGG